MGNVSKVNHKEIVVSLFSGKIASLIDSSAGEEEQDNNAAERKLRIEQLAKEKMALMKKKEKKQAKATPTAASSGIVGFKCNYKFSLIPKEAAYSLIIETQVNMNIILLQSPINIDLLDIDKIPGQVSFAQSDQVNQFLVTVKLSEE